MIICSPQLGISNNSNLGGEVYDREIIKGLDNLGVTTLIILPFGKDHPPLKFGKIYNLPTPFVYPPILFNLLIIPHLFYLKAKYDFKVLRIHNPHYVGIGAMVFGAFNKDVKLLPSYLHLESDFVSNWIDKFLTKRFQKIITISSATKEELVQKYQIPPSKISLVPPAIDKKFKPEPKDPTLVKRYNLSQKKVLLFLGQIIPRKNIAFLLKLMTKLPKDYVLLIAGDGPLLKQFKEENQDKRIIFMGKIEEGQKVKIYNLADIFLYPTLLEGFGLSVGEALNCGIKTIANKLKVFEEFKSPGLVLLDLKEKDWLSAIKKFVGKKGEYKIKSSWQESAKKFYEEAKTQKATTLII